MAGEGEWQVVTRRKCYPDNWMSPSSPQVLRTKPYVPYDSKLTYAQALIRNSSSLAPSVVAKTNSANSSPNLTPTITPNTSTPNTPTSRTASSFYISPHSPSRLRFPPSLRYTEWKGRCFKCCRRGHSAASCHNPAKCGKCWADGHIGNNCKAVVLNPAAMPYWPATKAQHQ